MKKILAYLLAVILVACVMSITASAVTSSPGAQGIVSGVEATDKNNNPVSLKLRKIDGKVTKEFQEGLKTLKEESGEKNLKVVAQYDVDIEGSPEYPVSVTFNVLGISDSSKVYVMVKEGNNIKTIETTVSKGKITFSVDSKIQSLAIVTDKATAAEVEKENDVLSPQTLNSFNGVALATMLSLMALVFVFKKVKA